MVRTILRMVSRAGREDEFVATWQVFASKIAAEPGNVGQLMLRKRGDRATFVIVSTWEDSAALDRFRDSPLRMEMSAALEELRESATNEVLDTVAAYQGIGKGTS